MNCFFEKIKKYSIELCLVLLLAACMVVVPSIAKYAEKGISAGSFDLNIVQNRQVFAVYGETFDANGDSCGIALNFYNRAIPSVNGTITLNDGSVQTVTEIYTGFDTTAYTANTQLPWYRKDINHITVVDEGISPVSTAYWFCFGTYNLYSINDIGKLDTSNVTSMREMFRNCNKLVSLDVSGLETGNVTDMRDMFRNCNQMTELIFGDFDTSKVTTMYQMFLSCSKLPTLDLSSFDTSSLRNIYRLFNACNALTAVYVSDKWDTTNITGDQQMFPDNLFGGAGTKSTSTNAYYARIDGGTSAPGYFTYYRYSVVFEANGGTGAPPMMLSNESATENTFTIPQGIPTGETDFLGWATSSDSVDPEYSPGDTFTSSNAYPCCDVLYAVWAPPGATTPEELEEDINDDGVADIGGGEWTFDLWDSVLDNVHTLTIHDGTFDGSMNLREAEFIINGGTINIDFFWCSSSNVTINDGTFTDPGVQFYTDSSSFNLKINGGTFAGIPVVTAGNFVIRGGTFGSNPAAYVDENCTVIDNGNDTWTVQPE